MNVRSYVKKNEYLKKGIRLKNHRNASREIATLHGKLTYTRSILIPADAESKRRLAELENSNNVIPLDQVLGIASLPFKMSLDLMLRCAYWAQNQPSYQKAEEALYEASHISVNDDTIRLVTNCIGKLVFEEDCRRTDALFYKYECGRLPHPKDRRGILYIEADGAALNTRHKNAEGSTWRENKLGVVFSSDHIHFWKDKTGKRQHQILKREYVSYVGGVDAFKRQLFACACRNGYGRYKETVILSDGATWIANMAEELFPDAQRILDLYHLKENVYAFARNKFNQDETAYVPWAKAVCLKLENGEWKEVLERLDPGEKYPNCVNLHHYIQANRNSMDYPEYQKKGYFMGSGAIESGNKVVLQSRLKQSGMRWEPETAQYLLTLRAKRESGLWQKDVVNYVREYYRNT